MGILGERPGQHGIVGIAREDDVAAQIAPRKIERHPDVLGVDRIGRKVARIEQVDIVQPFGLEVLHQVAAVLGHPCLERLVLEFVVRFRFVFRAGRQHQKAGERHVQKTSDKFHIFGLYFTQLLIRRFHRGVRVDRIHCVHRKKPGYGTLIRDKAEIIVAIGHIVCHIHLDGIALAATK